MTLYFDASAVAAVILNEPAAPAVDQVIRSSANVVVTAFSIAEVSSAIARLHRMKSLATPTERLFRNLDDWVATFARLTNILDDDVWRAAALVRTLSLKLRTPDALHLAVCERLGAQLVTLDGNLAKAARVQGVSCLNPAEVSAL